MILNKAVFLDRDSTIGSDVPYCSRPEDFEIIATVPREIKLLNENGTVYLVLEAIE